MKLKKQICLFLAFFVLVSNIGFALNVHYCDNQIAAVSFNTSVPSNIEEDCCGLVPVTSHCCKDRVVLLEKKSDQAVVKSFAFEFQDVVLPEIWSPVFNAVDFPVGHNNAAAYYCDSNAPPLFKLYSQYIFFDLV